MHLKTYIDESFEYYKEPVFLVASPTCSFKCCTEAGLSPSVCQNEPWASKPTFRIQNSVLIELYVNNPITKAFCFAGLEPLDQFGEICEVIRSLREDYGCEDPVIIYTGYNKSEVPGEIAVLSRFSNIIVKFGRYVPNASSRFDPILGVTLASDNQYAEVINL